MQTKKVVLIGGSGFLGGWVANRLSPHGVRILIPTRRRDHHKAMTIVPTVDVLQADANDPATLRALLAGVDVVVNLVGILHDGDGSAPYGKRFAAAHVELPKKILAAMRETGVRRLVHVSALKAAPDAPSAYLRSKAEGEAIVRAAMNDYGITIFRPSVIFGPGDSFLNTFAGLLRALPVIPLAGARARFQPVYVGDVADAIVGSLGDMRTYGQTYELGGPQIYTLREIVEFTGQIIGRRRRVIALSAGLAHLQARLLSLLPGPLMSPDNLRSMQVDNVCDGTLAYPDWHPQSLAAVVPTYLSTVSPRLRFDSYRQRAGR